MENHSGFTDGGDRPKAELVFRLGNVLCVLELGEFPLKRSLLCRTDRAEEKSNSVLDYRIELAGNGRVVFLHG